MILDKLVTTKFISEAYFPKRPDKSLTVVVLFVTTLSVSFGTGATSPASVIKF